MEQDKMYSCLQLEMIHVIMPNVKCALGKWVDGSLLFQLTAAWVTMEDVEPHHIYMRTAITIRTCLVFADMNAACAGECAVNITQIHDKVFVLVQRFIPILYLLFEDYLWSLAWTWNTGRALEEHPPIMLTYLSKIKVILASILNFCSQSLY